MPTLNKIGTALSRSSRPSRPPRTPTTDPALRRLRIALTVFFAVDGFLFAGWVVRIPAIKAQTGASASQLGLALLGVSAGAVATMVLTGRLCRRFGSDRVTVGTAIMLSLSIALPPQTHSALTLGLVLLVFGIAYGGLNVAMNSLAVDLVTALRRPVMSSFHAAYSCGGLVGAGLGGLLAPHLSPAVHLALLTPLGLVTALLTGRILLGTRLQPPPERIPPQAARASTAAAPTAPTTAAEQIPAQAAQAPRPTSPETMPGGGTPASVTARHPGLLVALFGLIAACSSYGEGALAEWGPLHVQQDLHRGPGVAAAGYAAVTLAMTLGRLSGTTLLLRFGQTRVLVLGGLLAAGGMLLAALAPLLPLVVLGFALTGLGLSNTFPTTIARAGALTGPGGVAAASTFGYGGLLLGPPTIGFLTDAVGLPVALTTVSALGAVAAVLAYSVRNLGRTEA
ncbi:MFS transporter [Streptomyces sp. NPDC021020]|uniref:MFS transporter n=1 Tax=Streptomyces sp. NPDC021020 TaxID=3365109 RepID=UPI0037A16DD8